MITMITSLPFSLNSYDKNNVELLRFGLSGVSLVMLTKSDQCSYKAT